MNAIGRYLLSDVFIDGVFIRGLCLSLTLRNKRQEVNTVPISRYRLTDRPLTSPLLLFFVVILSLSFSFFYIRVFSTYGRHTLYDETSGNMYDAQAN